MVCEIVLFCNPYDQRRVDLCPCGAPSNINGVGADLARPGDFMTLRAPSVVAFQTRFVEKIVAELNAFDNVYYELCNEPALAGAPDAADQAEQTAAWHAALAGVIRRTEATLAGRHLIAANLHLRVPLRAAGALVIASHDEARVATLPEIDILNYHYISSLLSVRGTRCVRLAGHEAEAGLIGPFLRQRDGYGKPIVFDETYSGIVGSAPECYAVNRAEAWEMMLAGGAGYSNLDWSFTPEDETGSGRAPVGDGRRLDGRALRDWLALLRGVLGQTDLATLAPVEGALACVPPELGSAISADGAGRTVVYLVDERVYWRQPCTARALTLELRLPAGRYAASTFDPRTGATATLAPVEGGTRVAVSVPPFAEDVALVFERKGS